MKSRSTFLMFGLVVSIAGAIVATEFFYDLPTLVHNADMIVVATPIATPELMAVDRLVLSHINLGSYSRVPINNHTVAEVTNALAALNRMKLRLRSETNVYAGELLDRSIADHLLRWRVPINVSTILKGTTNGTMQVEYYGSYSETNWLHRQHPYVFFLYRETDGALTLCDKKHVIALKDMIQCEDEWTTASPLTRNEERHSKIRTFTRQTLVDRIINLVKNETPTDNK